MIEVYSGSVEKSGIVPNKSDALRLFMAQFTGSERFYSHWSRRIHYTDGIKAMAEKAEAYWLIDVIASWQTKRNAVERFQIWHLNVKDSEANVYMQTDKGASPRCRQKIEYTDFPSGKWKFYVVDRMLMLPSEY